MKARVLVVDDEKDIRELIKFYLNKEGFEVLEAGDGEEALEIFENEYIDLGIIDVMMPVMDGFELVENLKEFKDIPVIMLTAKGESKDKLRGFSVGADDYVVKPFDPTELMARVRAVLKRYSVNTSNIVKLNDVEFDGDKFWGMDYDGFDRTVDVHIKRIRENLGHLPGFKVVTVRGLGYKVEVE